MRAENSDVVFRARFDPVSSLETQTPLQAVFLHDGISAQSYVEIRIRTEPQVMNIIAAIRGTRIWLAEQVLTNRYCRQTVPPLTRPPGACWDGRSRPDYISRWSAKYKKTFLDYVIQTLPETLFHTTEQSRVPKIFTMYSFIGDCRDALFAYNKLTLLGWQI